ncbi:MAG: DUF6264 family protein [Schumannella sp.]
MLLLAIVVESRAGICPSRIQPPQPPSAPPISSRSTGSGVRSARSGCDHPAPVYGVPRRSRSRRRPAARARKTWDLVLTVVLYVLGFFGMLGGIFLRRRPLRPGAAQPGPAAAGLWHHRRNRRRPAVLIVSHVILYLIAIGGSLPLLITKRVAFWVPLACGIIAAVVFWGARAALLVVASAPGLLPTS